MGGKLHWVSQTRADRESVFISFWQCLPSRLRTCFIHWTFFVSRYRAAGRSPTCFLCSYKSTGLAFPIRHPSLFLMSFSGRTDNIYTLLVLQGWCQADEGWIDGLVFLFLEGTVFLSRQVIKRTGRRKQKGFACIGHCFSKIGLGGGESKALHRFESGKRGAFAIACLNCDEMV